MHPDELYMSRCFDLACLGAGQVSPNPMVGAVLVHENRIIGEGWHQKYGEAHAEVNCLNSVSPENQQYIPYSTLYCSLEPCFHFGKTPPCVDLILKKKIPRVVICNTDPNPLVGGQSIEKMKAAGIDLITGISEDEGKWLNRFFFTRILNKRPFVILKWAQSADGFVGKKSERTQISGAPAGRLVHKWRSEADAILVGSETAVTDNPRLDVRHFFGKNPLRIAFDRNGKIPPGHHLLDDTTGTWIFGPERPGNFINTLFFPVSELVAIPDLLNQLLSVNAGSLLVEGGPEVLSQFIKAGYWDEIRLLENKIRLGNGIPAPSLPASAELVEEFHLRDDLVRIFRQTIFS